MAKNQFELEFSRKKIIKRNQACGLEVSQANHELSFILRQLSPCEWWVDYIIIDEWNEPPLFLPPFLLQQKTLNFQLNYRFNLVQSQEPFSQ